MAIPNPARSVDPITFEILSHRLHQIAKETGITLERVGGTVNTTPLLLNPREALSSSNDSRSSAELSGSICSNVT